MPMVGFLLSPVTVPSNLGSKACLNFLGSIFQRPQLRSISDTCSFRRKHLVRFRSYRR